METKLKVLQKLRITLNLTLTVQNKINLMQKTTKFCNLITCPDPCGYSPTGTSFWNLSHQATNLQESFCKTSVKQCVCKKIIHEYKLTSYSLYAAACNGFKTNFYASLDEDEEAVLIEVNQEKIESIQKRCKQPHIAQNLPWELLWKL